MSRRPDDGDHALNAIEADLWTSDPEFYRQFEQAWFSHAGREVVAVPRREIGLWLLPVSLVVIGVVLCMIVIQSRP